MSGQNVTVYLPYSLSDDDVKTCVELGAALAELTPCLVLFDGKRVVQLTGEPVLAVCRELERLAGVTA